MSDAKDFVTAQSQSKIVELINNILLTRRKNNLSLVAKIGAIDAAYAQHIKKADVDEADTSQIGNLLNQDKIIPPIVTAQVDSMVAYLADVFLSGSPLFPVVSNPADRNIGEHLEILLDEHANVGGYVRQLLLMLRDGVKYNVSAIDTNWTAVDQYSVIDDVRAPENARGLSRASRMFTSITRIDPLNAFWDTSVPIGDVSRLGDYAGYVELLSKTKLKTYLNKLTIAKKSINNAAALTSTIASGSSMTPNFLEHEQVSDYAMLKKAFTWDMVFADTANSNMQGKVNLYDGSVYEKVTAYVRVLPSDLDIKTAAANTPQIWRFVIINSKVLVEAERVMSAYEYLPMLFGQPIEDGLGYQTKSTAESVIPFQESATTLFNIRFAAARRAVSDRALYNPSMIEPDDINSPNPAAKIPVIIKPITGSSFAQAYQSIPFSMMGTEGAIGDARQIVSFAQELTGLNNAQQGQFQKGNKSVQEWNDVIGNSNGRLRTAALLYEAQVFSPLKSILALNIYKYATTETVVSQKTGEAATIDIDILRKAALAFKVSDGYSPKAKLASLDTLAAGLNTIMNSPILQQAYGASLPNIFAHMMQLGGVTGLDQYAKAPNSINAPIAIPITNQLPQATQGDLNATNSNRPTDVQSGGNLGGLPATSNTSPAALP